MSTENSITAEKIIRVQQYSSGSVSPKLYGEYGDIFSSLKPPVTYSANNDLFTNIYVANVTSTTREYMLQASLYRGDERLDQFIVTIDGKSWFKVEPESIIQLPTTLRLSTTDAVLVIDLYERESGDSTDSIATALTSRGTEGLPEYPQLPTLPPIAGAPTADFGVGSIMSMMITVMMMVMMMRMMSSSIEKVGKEK